MNAIYRERGVALPPTRLAPPAMAKAALARALVLAPPRPPARRGCGASATTPTRFASGWMQVRGNRRRRGVDRGFVLSDHADWRGLIAAIEATGAERVLVTHGVGGDAGALPARAGARGDGAANAEYGDEDLGRGGMKAFADLYRAPRRRDLDASQASTR